MQTESKAIENYIFESGLVLNPMTAEQPRINENTLPHYCGSLLLEIPLGKYVGVKSFGDYTFTNNQGEVVNISMIEPFVLIPITNSQKKGPAEAIPQGLPDRNNPEAFNPYALNNGVQTIFNFTAKQNAQKLISEMGGNGCFIWHSLTGRTDAAEIYNAVLPINNLKYFPRIERAYRATMRKGVFLDQVENYLKFHARQNISSNQTLTEDQKVIAWKFYEELTNAVGRAAIFCSGQVERISAEISKGIRTPFSFAKETADAPYPFDFMILAHLNMEEPSVSRPITSKNQAQKENDTLLAKVIEQNAQTQQTTMLMMSMMMKQMGMELPAGIMPQAEIPAPATTKQAEIETIANAPIFIDEVNTENLNVSDELFGEEKPKKTLSPEQLAKMQEGRRKAQDAKQEAKAA